MAARRKISFSSSKKGAEAVVLSAHALFAVLLLEPIVQGCFGDPEVLGNLVEPCFPFTGDSDNVTMELGGKGFGHGAHPSCEWILVRLGDNQTLGSPK